MKAETEKTKDDWLWLKSEIEELVNAKLNDVEWIKLCRGKRHLAKSRGFNDEEWQKAYSRVIYLKSNTPKSKSEPIPEPIKEEVQPPEFKPGDARRCAPVVPAASLRTKSTYQGPSILDLMDEKLKQMKNKTP
jgi:hypothetical protein